MKKSIRYTTLLWFFFFVAVSVVVYVANFRFNMYGDALFLDHRSIEPAPRAETMSFWHNLYRWDAGWYANIVQYGYTSENSAFFPLYPVCVRILMTLWHGSDTAFFNATFLISLITVWYSIYAIFAVSREETGREYDFFSPIFFLFFPTAFFLSAPYTESLFIALMLGAILMITRKKYVGAAIFSFLLSLTRLTGVLFIFFPLYLLFFSHQKRTLRLLIPAGASLIGLLAFMVYQKITFGSFFLFLHAQKEWGRTTSLNPVSIVAGLWNELNVAIESHAFDPAFMVYATEVLFTLFGIGAVLFLFYRGKREYALLSATFLLLPLVSGTLYSMPRLILPIVPLFSIFFAAHMRNEWIRHMLIVGCVLLWTLFLTAFTRLYWVA